VAERQLPKLNVAGSIPVSRSKKINDLQYLTKLRAPFVLHSHHEQLFLQLVHRGQTACDR
jgi:hypothetical protein